MELVVFLITRDIVFCELEICYIYECCIRKMIHTRCEVGYGHAVKWSDKILQERKKRVHHNLPKTDTALTNEIGRAHV